jgi:56kDa selenium binding protein (SBP56)
MKFRTLAVSALAVCAVISLAHAKKPSSASSNGSPYLFVWAGDEARQASDFLSVIDANPSSPQYGRIVRTVPVGITGSMPHHFEYEFPQSNLLFANGWVAGHTFIFDLSQPLKPRIATQFQDRAGYSFPHSFVRLPNGNVLATFQSHGGALAADGGLVELQNDGSVVRSSSALDPAVDKDLIWPYSMAIAPQIDRLVSSSSPMGWPDWGKLPSGSWTAKKMNDQVTAQVQVWRLSDLHLLNTVTLPSDSGKHNQLPAEPRLLPDGSIYVNTFSCGLYRLKDATGAQPSAELVHTFPGGDSPHTICSVPVVVGHYWIQTVAALPGLIALDITHPEKPVEVSRLVFDSHFPMPHWLSADRKSDRLVITGDMESWVLVAHFDPAKGTLSLDQSFRAPGATVPGISFDRQQWPHGKAGRALVHGALFGPQ